MTFEKKETKRPLKLNIQFFSEPDKIITPESLKTLQSDFKKSWNELKGLLDTQNEEIRTHGQTATQTADQIKNVEGTIATLEKDLKGVTEQFKDIQTKMGRPNFGTKEEKYLSAGERFAESDVFQHMVKNNLTNSQPYQVGSFFKMFKKDLDSTDPNGGILVAPQNLGMQAPMDAELRMRDILNVQRTNSNAIEYIQETGFTNSSAPVAEKLLKPESDLTFASTTATVKTLAHWIPATRQIIADAQQLRNYVDGRLIYGLKLTEENQLLYGSGVGENIQGLMTHVDVQDAGPMDEAGGETRIDHIRRSITLARLAGYPVTGIILSPTDWQEIELSKGTDGHYIWITVPAGGETRLWRVPVVESQSMRDNEFLLGAFGLGSQIWDREEANVRVSDHHADFFIRNQIAVLAEERICQTIYRPEAFVKGTFIPPATV